MYPEPPHRRPSDTYHSISTHHDGDKSACSSYVTGLVVLFVRLLFVSLVLVLVLVLCWCNSPRRPAPGDSLLGCPPRFLPLGRAPFNIASISRVASADNCSDLLILGRLHLPPLFPPSFSPCSVEKHSASLSQVLACSFEKSIYTYASFAAALSRRWASRSRRTRACVQT